MLNKIIVIGNVGSEPEMRYVPSGKAVTTFSLATNKKYTVDGERKEETTWFRITAWGKQAETCNQYVVKGMRVYVEGEVRIDEWDTQEGEHKSRLAITARQVLFLSRVEQNDEGDDF